ncbi:ferric siderophore receptor [Ignatzschineria cameli]|uniref:Ferric siderophore receptor n=2 Tax=Ignatzschineria cameli TaxID=2182793 RepID=A0A2U2AJE9_9GAMM|nr:ferric siderophore receptor [Ignatzschineria cameli]PWD86806.1 ferric siderophore receptor [Ignatzschineria cameli]PWD88447.1 ferric siderophore receptor [Ignatzschineria cameli]PWD88945.1 ferric siderophore receptor [Ignatzschineria cameli]
MKESVFMRRNILSQRLRLALVMAATSTLLWTAQADEIPLEQSEVDQSELVNAVDLGSLVVTASGFAQEVKDAPASISVVGQESINEKPFTNIGDVLRDIEGVNITRGGKTGGVDIGIRGLESKYTLMMIDGQRLSQNTSGARPNGFGDVDSAFIPPSSAIERIEVVRGPMSTLYGSDALGGVVNVITKKVPDKWGGQVSVAIEEPTDSKYPGGNTTSFYLGGPIKTDLLGLALMGSFQTQRNAKGTYLSAKDEYTPLYKLGGFGERRNFNYGARLSFTPENQEFVLSYDRGVQRYDNSEGQLGTLNSEIIDKNNAASKKWAATGEKQLADYNSKKAAYDEAMAKDPNQTAVKNPGKVPNPGYKGGGGYSDHLRFTRDRIGLTHRIDLDSVVVESGLLWDQTKTIGRTNPMVIASGNSAPYELEYSPLSGQKRDIKYTNLIFDNKWMFGLGDHFISAGMQYRHQALKDTLVESPLDIKQYQWALFAEDEWMINDDLIATFGLRYDKNEDFGSHFSPRAYLVWNIDDNWQVKGGVSRAFRAPDLQQLHDDVVMVTGQGTAPILGNPNLKPETSTSAELGFSYTNLDDFNFNVTAFYTRFKDKIDSIEICKNDTSARCSKLKSDWPDAGKISQYQNLDNAKLYGIELGTRYQALENLALSANYTYTESRYRDNANRRIPFSKTPRHMVNLKGDWKITPEWNLWAEASFRAKEYRGQEMGHGVDAKGKATTFALDKKLFYRSYTLVNVGASYKPARDLSINFGVNNLFNKNFIDYQEPEAYGLRGKGYQNRYARVEEGRKLWLKLNYEF